MTIHPDVPPHTELDNMTVSGINPNTMNCPNCDAPPSQHVVRQWGIYPGDADHYCGKCGSYVRARNSG